MHTLATLCSDPSFRLKFVAILMLAGAVATPIWGCATQGPANAAMSIAAGLLMTAWAYLAKTLTRLSRPLGTIEAKHYRMGQAATC